MERPGLGDRFPRNKEENRSSRENEQSRYGGDQYAASQPVSFLNGE